MPLTNVIDDAFICHECLEILPSPGHLEEHRLESGHKTAAKIKVDGVVKFGDKQVMIFELS